MTFCAPVPCHSWCVGGKYARLFTFQNIEWRTINPNGKWAAIFIVFVICIFVFISFVRSFVLFECFSTKWNVFFHLRMKFMLITVLVNRSLTTSFWLLLMAAHSGCYSQFVSSRLLHLHFLFLFLFFWAVAVSPFISASFSISLNQFDFHMNMCVFLHFIFKSNVVHVLHVRSYMTFSTRRLYV